MTYSLLAHLGVTETVTRTATRTTSRSRAGSRATRRGATRLRRRSRADCRARACRCERYTRAPRSRLRCARCAYVGARSSPVAESPRRMHLHILGICGTFMGGIAAIARQRRAHGDRLRRQRLSADEHAARVARHRADRGLRRERSSTRSRATPTCSSSATRSRAAIRCSRPYSMPTGRIRRVRSGSPRTCCATSGCSRSPERTARQRPARCSPGYSITRACSPVS